MSLFTNVPLPLLPPTVESSDDRLAHKMELIMGSSTKVQVQLLSKYLNEQRFTEDELIERTSTGGLSLTPLGLATVNKFTEK